MHSLHLRKNNALLVDRVLGMDSLSFREDVAAVAPDFLSSVHLKNSPPHNSLDSTDSNKSSARVQDDTDGLVFARASNGCLWLCKSYFLIFTICSCYIGGYDIVLNCFNMHEIGLDFSIQHFRIMGLPQTAKLHQAYLVSV